MAPGDGCASPFRRPGSRRQAMPASSISKSRTA